MGQAEVAAEPALHRRQRLQPVAGRRARRRRSSIWTATSRRRARSSQRRRRCSPLISDFLRWEPIPPKNAKKLAEVSARLCRLLRDEVTEQLALGSPAPDRPREGLAQAAFPGGERRAVRRRLRAGRHLRPADGPGARHPAVEGHRPGGAGTPQDQLADRHGAPAADRRRRQPGGAEDLARHADARSRRRGLAHDQQGQAGRLALLLRGLSGGLRQRAAEAHRLLLHAAGGRGAMVRLVDEALRGPLFERPAGLASPDVTRRRSGGRHRHVPARRAPPHRGDRRGRPGRGRRARRDRRPRRSG